MGKIISKFLFFLIFASSFLHAQEVKVFYFGGVKSQKQVLDGCYPGFRNFGYPLSEKEQKDLIEEIKTHPQQKYLLVGHSSGTSYAMSIVKAPGISNRSRLTLIDLDGFAPVGVPSNVRTVCWNAKNSSGKKSRNYSSMRAETCNEKYTVNADHCDVSSDWCLHFAVANPSAPAKLTDWGGHGYDDCAKEDAEWVKMELPQSKKIPKAIKSIQSK